MQIRFDFHGNGESEGDEDWSFGGYLEEAEDDLHAVVESCSSYDLEVVCLVGHSRASTTVLLYASLYDHIPLIISLAGRFDLKQGIEKHLKGYKGDSFKSFSVLTAGTALGKEADVLDKSLLYEQDDRNTGNISHTIKHTKQDKPTEVEEKVEYVSPDGRKRVITHKCVLNRLTLDLRNYLSKIKKTKQILVIHGSADTTIPVEDALQLANALPSGKTKVVIIEKASHDLLDTQAIRTQVIESISQFITDNGMSCKKSS